MSDYVLPQRFVNTPTVMEIWEQEHVKEPKEHTTKEVEDLSEEADVKAEVTGTESYYRWAMQYQLAPVLNARTGNEGFWSTVKGAFNTFIENVKKFFKWVFSFFTSKKRMVDQTTDKLEKTIKIKGVKEGMIPYPKDYALIWNAEGKPGQDITWIKTKLTGIDSVINSQADGYVKELSSYIQALGSIVAHSKDGQLSESRAAFDKAETAFTTNLKKIIKPGPFLSGTILEVGKNGKLLTKTNTKVAKGVKGVSYKTTTSIVEGILDAVNHTNDIYGAFTHQVVQMENIFITNLNETLRFGNQLELKDPAAAKAITDKIKQNLSVAMSNLKMLETILYKAINAGLSVANAAIKKDGGAKAPEDKK